MSTKDEGREEAIINIHALRNRVERFDSVISQLKEVGVIVDEGGSYVSGTEFYFYNATKTEQKLFSATRIEIFIRLAEAYLFGFKNGRGSK